MVDYAARATLKVCVFGSGSFGTALGTVIARNGFPVTLLTRREEVSTTINTKHENPTHLSSFKLPPLLAATTSPKEALEGAAFIVHCIPVQSTEQFMEPLKELIPPGTPIISTSKGLHSETLETMADLLPRILGRPQPTAFLSGPTFAKELMESYPSGAVMASADIKVAEQCATLFTSKDFRCYMTTDVIGVEIGGALKNVYALAAGAIEGMGLGVNTIAFLVTRACAEMNVVAVAMGGRAHTMASLAGIGDLMLTCMGGASRNKAVGARIGQGETISKILESRGQSLAGVAEGVATAPAAAKMVKQLGVETPLINAVASVLAGETDVRKVGLLLMTSKPPGEDFAKAAHSMERQKQRAKRLPLGLGLSTKALTMVALGEAVLLGGLAVHMIWRRRS